MKNNLYLVLLLSFCFAFTSPQLAAQTESEGMNNKKMEEIITRESKLVEGKLGNWQFEFHGQMLFMMTDEANNRMRIFTPVKEEKELKAGQMRDMLGANFHSALDSKYSLYEGFVISVFTHPLKELTEAQLVDAMLQVATLAANFGTTYSSTTLIFGGGQSEEEPEKRINKKPGGKS